MFLKVKQPLRKSYIIHTILDVPTALKKTLQVPSLMFKLQGFSYCYIFHAIMRSEDHSSMTEEDFLCLGLKNKKPSR